MEFQRVNRTDPERIFIVVRNSYSTASLTNGQWCAWDTLTDKDGVNVTKPLLQLRAAPAGVAVETSVSGAYGLVQVWGYKSDCRCLGGTGLGTSKISNGTPLYLATSGFNAHAIGRTSADVVNNDHARFPCGIGIEPLNTAAAATSSSVTAAFEVLIRCL